MFDTIEIIVRIACTFIYIKSCIVFLNCCFSSLSYYFSCLWIILTDNLWWTFSFLLYPRINILFDTIEIIVRIACTFSDIKSCIVSLYCCFSSLIYYFSCLRIILTDNLWWTFSFLLNPRIYYSSCFIKSLRLRWLGTLWCRISLLRWLGTLWCRISLLRFWRILRRRISLLSFWRILRRRISLLSFWRILRRRISLLSFWRIRLRHCMFCFIFRFLLIIFFPIIFICQTRFSSSFSWSFIMILIIYSLCLILRLLFKFLRQRGSWILFLLLGTVIRISLFILLIKTTLSMCI